MRRLLLLTLFVIAAHAAAAPAQAMEVRTGDAITVPAGTIVADDLFAAGETVTVAGGVNGDVYAFARTITVTGTIERDLIAAGQYVTIDGVVKGDLRAAGQQVVINGRVDGNVSGAGELMSLNRQGQVDGSVLAAAQHVNLLGPVGRGVTAGASTMDIGGNVGGNVDAHVATLTVEPSARIAGQLSYASERETSIPAGAVAGGVQYRAPEHRESRGESQESPFGGLFNWFNLAWLIGSVIAGVLLVRFLPEFAAGAAAQVREHPLPSFGIGVLALFAVPLAALVVAFTLIGLPLSLLLGLGYLAALYVGQLLLGLAVGGLLVELARRRGAVPRLQLEWLMVLGLVAVYVLTHLPWIGGLATFVAICLGLGALLRQVEAAHAQRQRPLAPPAAV